MAKDEKKSEEKKKQPTALKRDRTSEEKRLRNRAFKAQIRTAVRDLKGAVDAKDKTAVKSALNSVYSLMDRSVKRGIFKANKAARTKARVAARISSLAL